MRVSVYFEPADRWVGYYRGDEHHYVCLLPCVVIRWPRRQPIADPNPVAPLDIEAMFPADPDLMASPEGDKRGLQQLQAAARVARARVSEPHPLGTPWSCSGPS
jgi:hypothetical protein